MRTFTRWGPISSSCLGSSLRCSAASCSTRRSGTSHPAEGFKSSVKFNLTPSQVNEMNVPTAKEVSAMLPSLSELRQQLPDAGTLERQYIDPANVDASAPSAAGTPAPPGGQGEGIFTKTTDPLEDLMFGPPEGEDSPKPGKAHVLLAYKALAWGTFYAVGGFLVTVSAVMYACGYYSITDLRKAIREKVTREEDRLRSKAVAQEGEDGTVVHYVVDLTNPAVAVQQMRDAWSAVQQLAEEESSKV